MIPLQLLKEVLLWLVFLTTGFIILSMFFGMCLIVNYIKGRVPWRHGTYGREWVGFIPTELEIATRKRSRTLAEMKALYGQSFEWPDR